MSTLRSLAARTLLLLAPLSAVTQAQKVWVPLTASGAQSPGLPALVSLSQDSSNESTTTFNLQIFGFWREPVVGDDGKTYDRLTFPGLERIDQVGAPGLPAVRRNVAVGRQTDSLTFKGVLLESTATFENILPLPTYVEGEDDEPSGNGDPGPGDTVGTEPKWAFDSAIYGGAAAWPLLTSTQSAPVEEKLGPIRGASVVFHPVKYDPVAGTLLVSKSLSVQWKVAGLPAAPLTLTKLKDEEAQLYFANWEQTKFYYPYNPVQYHSRYLIVAQSMWWPTLAKFKGHKQAQGFQTAMVQAPANVDAIRDIIANWYYLGDPGMDHYCLLVGDTDQVPLVLSFESGVAVRGDDPYGCVGSLDQSKEVYVGRISADSVENLGMQLDKIIDYELNPAPGDYHEALLVSHKEGAPEKYTGSHIAVRDASYSSAPTFLTLFGESGADNLDVFAAINDGVGLVAYRGHGSTTTWSKWNTAAVSLHKDDLGPNCNNSVRPVIWSISCTNSNLNFDSGSNQDCISEVWMEATNGGVAAYGASQTTSTTPNHHLNEELFRIVYDQGITTHAKAIELAEQSVWAQWPGHKNPWAYLLLGDPSMTIRRGPVLDLGFSSAPNKIFLDEPTSVLALTASSSGDLFEKGLVSVHKASFLGGGADEASGAYWIGDGNHVDVPIAITTPGTLTLTVRDGNGNLGQKLVPVPMGKAWKDLGQGMTGEYGEARCAGIGTLQGGSPWSLLLAGAKPGATAWLCLSATTLNIPFLGGTLIPNILPPGFFFPVPVNEFGDAQFGGTWPDGIPGGIELYFQFWVEDPSGPEGLVGSNGVRARTPL